MTVCFVLQQKTLMHMCNSQDNVSVLDPDVALWKLESVEVKEGTAELSRGEERAVVRPAKVKEGEVLFICSFVVKMVKTRRLCFSWRKTAPLLTAPFSHGKKTP
jgi:hypothetical protein